MVLISGSQAAINHLGIGVTARLTDFSGYWILLVSDGAHASLLAFAPGLDPSRLVTFENFSGSTGGNVWPATLGIGLLFAQGLLLPAYTITGFDASAHAAEETIGAAESVPRGIVRSVLVSGVAGWVLLAAVVLAAPSVSEAAAHGEGAFLSILNGALPRPLCAALVAAIVAGPIPLWTGDGDIGIKDGVCLCTRRRPALLAGRALGLPQAALTTAMRSGASWRHPCYSRCLRRFMPPSPRCARSFFMSRTSCRARSAPGLTDKAGRRWARGTWGIWYRPLAILSAAGCMGLIVVGMQPPNQRSVWVVGGCAVLLAMGWLFVARHRFPGPPMAKTGNRWHTRDTVGHDEAARAS